MVTLVADHIGLRAATIFGLRWRLEPRRLSRPFGKLDQLGAQLTTRGVGVEHVQADGSEG